MRKSASDVPSLKRLSPSKIRESRLGAPYSLKSASTATGSVAEISAPKIRVTMNGTSKPISPRQTLMPTAAKTAEIRRLATASQEIDWRFSVISRTFML